jgi:hypothetical protein
MENQELLNPESENTKKEAGVENQDSDKESQTIADVSSSDTQSVADAPDQEPVSSSEQASEPDTPEVAIESSAILTKEPEEEIEEEYDESTEIDDTEATDLATHYNAMGKEDLVKSLEELVGNDDIHHIRKHIGYIKVAFRNYLKEHSVSEIESVINENEEAEQEAKNNQVDELADRFNKAFSVYKDKKHVYDQGVEKQKHSNLKIKQDILDELRKLIDSEEELKKSYDHFKELQETWRQTGPVPQNEKNQLWNTYHFLIERFIDKVKINKELRDLDYRKNLEIKKDLCEKAEELLVEPSINKSFHKLQKLHDAWKETGPVPKDKKDELWDRFKAASDAINDRRQAYYDSLRDEQSKNYAAKVVLCEQAEQLADFTSDSPKKWQDATVKVNELFNIWKTVGFAPKKINDEVWVRFRAALDGFFNNKQEFFSKYKDEQTENYNQKLNLCMQAEALRESQDWKHTTEELISLQQQWKKIGPVPKKFSDKIWKRFRAACDDFFTRKTEYFSNIGEKQEENLQKKKELIEKVKSHSFSNDNTENLNILKDFQRQWMEIGHVPLKEKEKLQNEFKKIVNELYENLNISRREKSTQGFKHKVENLKNSPNAENVIYKERMHLVSKINGLQNDIKLWENNIGFFASSRKADVLKLEFENKIEKAKADIQVLEQKLKILNASL